AAVFPIREEAARQQIRVRIACVHGTGGIGAEVVRARDVVSGIDADIAGHLLEIKAELDVMSALDPGEVGADGLELIRAIERPTAVEPVLRRVRDGLAGGLSTETVRESEVDVRSQVQIIGREDAR